MQVIMKIVTLIVLEVFKFIIAVKDNVTLTSWITCPNSCNDTASTKFRMQLFRNTNGENSVQVSELQGNVNFTDTTLNNNKIKEIINRLEESSYGSSWMANFTAFRKRNILCKANQCKRDKKDVFSCNSIYVVNSESKKRASSVDLSTAAALEAVEKNKAVAATSQLNYQTTNGIFNSSPDSETSTNEQSISTCTKNGIFVQTRGSTPLWPWLMLIGSVIMFVIILSFGLLKSKRRRPKTRNAKAVNNSFQSEAYFTNNVVSDTQQFSNQQLEYFDFASSENDYDVAYQWNERSKGKSNLYDHVDMNVHYSRVGLSQNVKSANIDDAAVDSKQFSNQQLEYCDAAFTGNEYDVAYHGNERNEGKSNFYDHMDMRYSRVGLSHNITRANKDDAAVNTKQFWDQQSEYFDFASPENEYDVAYHWNERRKDESNLYDHVDMNLRCSRVGFSRSRQQAKTDSDLC